MSAGLIPFLNRAGHDIIETREVGKSRAKDDELLLVAATTGRVFITYNEKDFVLLHDAWRRWSVAWGVDARHAGILILPQPPHLSNEAAAEHLNNLLTSGLTISSELYLLHPRTGWTRRLAVSG